jgi:ubiquinone/menaquinone biosynthesis C-methylase UbiE
MDPSPSHPLPIYNVLHPIDAGRVLDVASGVGQFTRLLVDCLGGFNEIVGIDTSEKAIGKANESFSEPTVRFEQADAASMPFPAHRFNTVTLSNSLHHMEDLEAVLAEIRRILVPGGRLILFEMHSDAPNPASQNAIDLHLWAAAVDRAIGRFHDPVLTREQLASQIESLHLQRQTVIDWHSEDETDDLEPILQAIDQVLNSAEGTPEQSELANEADVLKERIRSTGMQSQPFILAVGSFPLED